MTDQPHDPTKPNDPLGEALRNEVPAPGANYWDAIDARLAAAATDRSDDAVIHLDHLSEEADTEDRVIRLTDMNTQTISPTQPTRTLVVAIAAVAALIVGIVGFAALRDDAPSTVEFADGTGGAAPDVDGGADGTTGEPADADPTPTSAAPTTNPEDAPEGADTPQPDIERRCFFEQYLPEDEPDPTVVWVMEVGTDTFRALLESPGPDGTTNQTFDSGTLDADGNGTTAAGMMIDFYDGGASRTDGEFEPFTAATVDCDAVADVDALFARLADGPNEASEPTPATIPEDAPAENPILELEFHETLVGLTEAAAQEAAEDAGRPWRVISIDGEALAVTKDLIPDRVNATIVDGIVTETSLG